VCLFGMDAEYVDGAEEEAEESTTPPKKQKRDG
jgi:hypothetical protein